MQKSGYFVAWRKTMFDYELGMGLDHDGKQIPFSSYEAWMWLLSTAVFEPKGFRLKSSSVKLETGQLSYSLRFLAKAWGWNKNAVAKYLKKLELRGAIKLGTEVGTEVGTGNGTKNRTVITICKYKSYQRKFEDPRTKNGTENGTEVGTEVGTNNNEINKEINKDKYLANFLAKISEDGVNFQGENPHVKQVLNHYIMTLQKPVTQEDVDIVKHLLKYSYPTQVSKAIDFFATSKYKAKFTEQGLLYIEQPVMQGKFGSKTKKRIEPKRERGVYENIGIEVD